MYFLHRNALYFTEGIHAALVFVVHLTSWCKALVNLPDVVVEFPDVL